MEVLRYCLCVLIYMYNLAHGSWVEHEDILAQGSDPVRNVDVAGDPYPIVT
jgi:hypothetical protein